MDEITKKFWRKQLEIAAQALIQNGFDAVIAADAGEAKKIAMEQIEADDPQTIGEGGSVTLDEIGLPDALRSDPHRKFLDGHDPALSPEEKNELRRQSLTCDLFVTGVNAVTTEGTLIWLDMIGNRIAPIAFGPKKVLLFAGRNKLVSTTEEGIQRVKTIAAPMNTMRLTRLKTPCQTTGICHDCSSPDRICNSWLIKERCFPKGRIRIVLINEYIGY